MRNENNNTKLFIEAPKFNGKNVSVAEASKALGKDQQFIRQGIARGILPIGSAFKREGSSQYDIYISPFLLWQFSGYIAEGSVD